VWRYACEFCKKSGCSAFHIRKHERGCTANPNRVCGLCAHVGKEQRPINDLVAAVRVVTADGDRVVDIQGLRDITGNCPACILAALRQSNVMKWDGDPEDVPPRTDFDFKTEMKSWWSELNDLELERERHARY
jgi:hypothetical protein